MALALSTSIVGPSSSAGFVNPSSTPFLSGKIFHPGTPASPINEPEDDNSSDVSGIEALPHELE